jgi:4-hydroxy-2-oxovalerate aldolase
MLVAANFMKSYTMEPAKFADKARMAQQFGADIVYVVDSAGGMMTDEMERYFCAVKEVCDLPLGFHGHNNLGLAVANTLRAAELGCDVVDTSLQGLGRSAGNTPTEMFLMVLERRGVHLGIDALRVMDIAEKYVRPLLPVAGYDSVDIVCGFSQFHTSYMSVIREFSTKYRIDPRRLIMAVCEHDKVDAGRDLVERLARRIQGESQEIFTARFRFDRYHGAEQQEP